MQEVGLVHSTKEASNDCGGKGLTYRLLLKQNMKYTRGMVKWKMRIQK